MSVTVAFFVIAISAWGGGKPKDNVLYSFGNNVDGAFPFATPTIDSAGNVYLTTWEGGTANLGSVVELARSSKGWNETVIHSFTGQPSDGGKVSAGVILDSMGNLYGTAQQGGVDNCDGGPCGIVYQLVPGSNGWTENVLHFFGASPDGNSPYSNVILDPTTGDLYGTTIYGGTGKCPRGCGTVYQLVQGSNGWIENVIHTFTGGSSDGNYPYASLVEDSAGNLYGTTKDGGANKVGTAYELSPSGNGWTEKVIYTFGTGTTDGAVPIGHLIMDSSGNLYGATSAGGASGHGIVFELSPGSQGFAETVLYNFAGQPDGDNSTAELIFDKSGNLYGTTRRGGTSKNCKGGCGTVFKLTPGSNGWTEAVLYSFNGFPSVPKDGAVAFGGITFGPGGHLLGETLFGGKYHAGVLYALP